MEFAAIPTVYNGVQMRSRLEARWAATFDLLGLSWRYEPIDLNGWIPDFVVQSIPGVAPCGNLKPEFQERITKPFLVEIKPISDSNIFFPPHDVTDKIENSLNAPSSSRRGGPASSAETWNAFFDALAYHPLLLGNDPNNAWLFQRDAGWWPAGQIVPNWQSTWTDAGNKTQWKSPR